MNRSFLYFHIPTDGVDIIESVALDMLLLLLGCVTHWGSLWVVSKAMGGSQCCPETLDMSPKCLSAYSLRPMR